MKRQLDFALLIGVILSVALTSLGVFARDCDEIKADVLRFHVIANSDSEEDQQLKYIVRDRLLAVGADLFASGGKDAAVSAVSGHLNQLEQVAAAALAEYGVVQPVKAELVNMYFDTRIYGEMTVAAGWYDAVRITIGEGKGKNWWCVMFPPMCLPSAQSGETLPEQEQLEALGQPQYVPKFAILELIEDARNRLFPQEEQLLAIE